MSSSPPTTFQPALSPVASGPKAGASRADDAAIRSLAAAIHAELRASLEPEDVVRLAAALLGRVADELQGRRV